MILIIKLLQLENSLFNFLKDFVKFVDKIFLLCYYNLCYL